jgi:hypothetical protein
VGRPFHVYDSDGEHLGSFATWLTAHDWAHLQIAVGSMAAPLEVEDRRSRTARRIWADRCTFSTALAGSRSWEFNVGDHLDDLAGDFSGDFAGDLAGDPAGDLADRCATTGPAHGGDPRFFAGPPAPRSPSP